MSAILPVRRLIHGIAGQRKSTNGGKPPSALAVAVYALDIGGHLMIDNALQRRLAYHAAYRRGRKVSIQLTTKGTWRVERIA